MFRDETLRTYNAANEIYMWWNWPWNLISHHTLNLMNCCFFLALQQLKEMIIKGDWSNRVMIQHSHTHRPANPTNTMKLQNQWGQQQQQQQHSHEVKVCKRKRKATTPCTRCAQWWDKLVELVRARTMWLKERKGESRAARSLSLC